MRAAVGVSALSLAGLAAWRGSLRTPRAGGLSGRGPGVIPPFLTPTESFYRFSNGAPPAELPATEASVLVGPGAAPRRIAWAELVPLATRRIARTLQCDGNGYIDGGLATPSPGGCQMARPDDDRARPPPENWSWRFGGIGTAEWDVVGVGELFAALGIEAVGDWLRVEGRDGYQRHFPAEVLADPAFCLAVSMNGQPLPHGHGAPARLLVPGQYGAMNVKWIQRLTVGPRGESHPFDDGPESHYPVKPLAFATMPRDGDSVTGNLELGGVAFAGERAVKSVLLWLDPAEPWEAELLDPGQPHVWSRWRSTVQIPSGTHEITVCCIDAGGRYSKAQAAVGDAEGYGGFHTLTVTVA